MGVLATNRRNAEVRPSRLFSVSSLAFFLPSSHYLLCSLVLYSDFNSSARLMRRDWVVTPCRVTEISHAFSKAFLPESLQSLIIIYKVVQRYSCKCENGRSYIRCATILGTKVGLPIINIENAPTNWKRWIWIKSWKCACRIYHEDMKVRWSFQYFLVELYFLSDYNVFCGKRFNCFDRFNAFYSPAFSRISFPILLKHGGGFGIPGCCFDLRVSANRALRSRTR